MVENIAEALRRDHADFGTVTVNREEKLFIIVPNDPHMTQQVIEFYREKYEVQSYWDKVREHFSSISRSIGAMLPGYTVAYAHPADPGVLLLRYVDGERVYDYTDELVQENPPVQSPEPEATTEDYWFDTVSTALELHYKDISTLSADKAQKRFILIPTNTTLARELRDTYAQNKELQESWGKLREHLRQASQEITELLPGYLLAVANPENPDNHLLRLIDGKVIYDYTDELIAQQPDLEPGTDAALTEDQWIETMTLSLANAFDASAKVTVNKEEKTFLIVPTDQALAQTLYQYHDVNEQIKGYWTATHTYFQGASREIHKVLPGYRMVFADPQSTARPLLIYADGILMHDFLSKPDQNPFPGQPGLETEDYWFQTLLQQRMELDKGNYHIQASKDLKQFRFIPYEYNLVNTLNRFLKDPAGRSGWTGYIEGFKAVSLHMSQYLPGYTVILANPASSQDDLLRIQDGAVIYDAFQDVDPTPQPGSLPVTQP